MIFLLLWAQWMVYSICIWNSFTFLLPSNIKQIKSVTHRSSNYQWLCMFLFSQSWKTVCQSWQPFWNMRQWISLALHHLCQYRKTHQKRQLPLEMLMLRWRFSNHTKHQILSGKIYTPCHCKFSWYTMLYILNLGLKSDM